MGWQSDFSDLVADICDSENFGVAISYSRGGDSVALTAAPVQPIFAASFSAGLSVDVEKRDYLIAVADLVIDEVETEPQRGDRITETLGDGSVTFEVMDESDGAWSYEDPAHEYYRVRCKRVATVAGS